MAPSSTDTRIPLGDINIVGDGHIITNVGGDYVAGDYVHHTYEAKKDFFRPNLEGLADAPKPRSLDEMAVAVKRRGLLMLGGAYEDKPGVARQLARHLAGGADAGRAVFQWQGGLSYERLLQGLETLERGAVVLLPGLRPSDVANDLTRLHRTAAACRHDVIATTEQARGAWKLKPGDESFWTEVAPVGLFDVPTLAAYLDAGLRRETASLPAGAFVPAEPPGNGRLAGVELTAVARQLVTPGNVDVFLEHLVQRGAEQPLAMPDLVELVKQAVDRAARAGRWFDGLRPEEQLLALGLTLYDGLYDDQVFAALERWIEHVRAHRDPAVRSFDYNDLNALGAFFERIGTESDAAKVAGRFPGQRRALFRAAWNSHRRQLLGAVQVLTELVAESAAATRSWELAGVDEHRRLLRHVAHEALSDLGALSLECAEIPLVSLACRGNSEVQAVAAEAVARWRDEPGGDEIVFRLLDAWQRDTRIRDMVASVVGDAPAKTVRAAQANVRGAVALAVGYASLYDPPNALVQKLVDHVAQLGRDQAPMVRRRFVAYTLPLAVSRHLRQLTPMLESMATDEELRRGIAMSLAFTYRTAPDEVVAVLDQWRQNAAATRPREIDRRVVTRRDALLIVVALTYGFIDYGGQGPLTAEAGFARLREILANERHPRIRAAVVDSIAEQAESHFGMVESLLQELLSEVTPAECDVVVRVLTRTYLSQRAALTGGDDTIVVDGESYRVWLKDVRPLTAIETAMERWVREPAYRAAQRIAFRATISFVQALDGPESNEVAKIQRDRQAQMVANEPLRWAPAQAGWYEGTFVPWLATRDEKELREPVATLLPEAIAERDARPNALRFVLDRWRKVQGDRPASRRLAEALASAMEWHGTAGVLLALGGIVVLVMMIALLVHLSSATPPPAY